MFGRGASKKRLADFFGSGSSSPGRLARQFEDVLRPTLSFQELEPRIAFDGAMVAAAADAVANETSIATDDPIAVDTVPTQQVASEGNETGIYEVPGPGTARSEISRLFPLSRTYPVARIRLWKR